MSFTTDIAQVIKDEGGYTPGLAGDSGGETYHGIARAKHPEWAGWAAVDAAKRKPLFPDAMELDAALQTQVVAFYRAEFADKVHFDDLPSLVQFMALTFAVNSGPDVAIRKLQHAAGVADDGRWGPVTQAAIKGTPPMVLVLRFVAECVDYRRKLTNFLMFANGWDARLANDLRFIATEVPA